MRFVAWYCYKCNMYLREIETLQGHRCPECKTPMIPQPVKTEENGEETNKKKDGGGGRSKICYQLEKKK